ncbi:MarR family transcriptional regulator [Metabacillus fastidiosus]|uniref:MarR family transcriptional regulator n=1 Tax=Metabacillus fastidiosus TaxID=1458 RepID=A0ABU6NYY3_9BACI|nr:MarR family transcriptional regulator [Metabacillus fastidiosus]MED4402241.1 MarR family transcriptional regulator [Metabacillus fastidiosus]MED4462111.1 MarR family transcriptional regulator [Metabacillus fastidiosus]
MKREEALKLRKDIMKFVRMFGFMDSLKKPLGRPLSVSQVMALEELESTKLTVWELANKLMLERSSVSRLVDKLIKEGLVCREENEKNRREIHLSLTDKGQITFHQIREQSVEFYQNVLMSLSELEQKKVVDGFELLIKSISDLTCKTNEEH